MILINSIGQFYEYFPNEEACVEALIRYKWPHGFRCSNCGSQRGYHLPSRQKLTYQCAACRRQESLTTGTLMEKSSTSLHKWFLALYYLSSGCSSIQLKDYLSVTYKTAWLIASKIRRAISDADSQNPLTGHVTISGAIYNLNLFWFSGLHAKEIPVIVGTSADHPNSEPTTIKMKLIDRQALKEGTYYLSDDAMPSFEYIHVNASNAVVDRSDKTSTYIKGFISLKKIAYDAHQSICMIYKGVGQKHLQKYLDEFCFRESIKRRGRSLFHSFLDICMESQAIPYRQIVAYE